MRRQFAKIRRHAFIFRIFHTPGFHQGTRLRFLLSRLQFRRPILLSTVVHIARHVSPLLVTIVHIHRAEFEVFLLLLNIVHRLLESLDLRRVRKVPAVIGQVRLHIHKFTPQLFLLQIQVRQLFLILFGQIFGRFRGDDIPQGLVLLILFEPIFEFFLGVIQFPVGRSGGLLAKQVRKLKIGLLRQGFKFRAF